MQEQKYNLVDLTAEELTSFQKDFQEFLSSRSIYFEPIPQYERKELTDPWSLRCSLIVKKKVAIVQEGAVASTDPEINPVA